MSWGRSDSSTGGPVDLRTEVPHSARIYDYLLGGRDNFAVDREAAAEIVRAVPHMRTSMRANRQFMCRVTRFLAERGFRQFLDIGTGLPTSPNLHEVAQGVAPESRVLYVDNDPMVLAHARALLTSAPEGRTGYVDADLRDAGEILESAEFAETFDPDQPVALSLIAILQFLLDEAEALGVVRRLLDALPSGSALALSTVTADSAPEVADSGVAAYRSSGINTKARTAAEVASLFDGLDLVDPGVVLVHRWHPDEDEEISDEQIYMYGAVGIKP
ncbi:SAM-dependent methyltransferase [Saccharopolyspora sp. NPDC002376]